MPLRHAVRRYDAELMRRADFAPHITLVAVCRHYFRSVMPRRHCCHRAAMAPLPYIDYAAYADADIMPAARGAIIMMMLIVDTRALTIVMRARERYMSAAMPLRCALEYALCASGSMQDICVR